MNELQEIPASLNILKKQVEKLYYKGDIKLLAKRKISIVGTRAATRYTENLTKELAYKLAKRDICIVSGAAMGVDSYAHKGAFPNTIAVMANSLDVIYPKINSSIISSMQEQSLVLSEYEPTYKATRYSFLERNRIVVALGELLVIPQADLKSGSMSSANLALDMNKSIYVFPQRLDESRGTNKLLSENKANLINDIDEFVAKITGISEMNTDEILEFCKKEKSFEICFAKFGSKIYEYELDGKLCIIGSRVEVLQ